MYDIDQCVNVGWYEPVVLLALIYLFTVLDWIRGIHT